VALVHGRMKPAEKEAVMRAFKDGKTQLLVATTVIEVGVDVPNASLMIVENAERLGLSQLHQLRDESGAVRRRARACSSITRRCRRMHAHASASCARPTTASRFHAATRNARSGRGARHAPDRRAVIPHRRPGARSGHAAAHRACCVPVAGKYPQHVTPLIRRWLGLREHYGEV